MTQPETYYSLLRDLKWSHTEKSIARKAFDRALKQELDSTLQEARARLARMKQPTQLWDLEHFLTERRKYIDRLYDFRYSVLPVVFGNLIRLRRLTEDDLRALREDKLAAIRRQATR